MSLGTIAKVAIGGAVIAGGAAAGALTGALTGVGAFSLGGDSVFPQDLENYPHYITFEFSEYQRRSIFDRAFFSGVGSIRLPIPANLVDQQSVTYGEEGSSPLVGAGIEAGLHYGGAAGGAAAAIGGGALSGAAGAAISGALGRIGGTLGRITGGAISGVAGQSPQALQMFGLAVNPFLTVLFKSPTFKRHSFAWRLSPNDPKESTLLNNVLTKFKYHMLPARAAYTAGAILKYPDICNVRLMPNDKWLYKFKPCVVESISVNYVPNGNPAFYNETKAPTEVQFTVNLMEIEYWLKEDFTALAGGAI
jgi:hypothetical protein